MQSSLVFLLCVWSAVQIDSYCPAYFSSNQRNHLKHTRTNVCITIKTPLDRKIRSRLCVASAQNDISDDFRESDLFKEEDIEVLVSKAEHLWAEALEARKLAEYFSEEVEKMAEEIETKVSPASCQAGCLTI